MQNSSFLEGLSSGRCYELLPHALATGTMETYNASIWLAQNTANQLYAVTKCACAELLRPLRNALGPRRPAGQKNWPYFLSSLILPLPVLHSSAACANETLRTPHLSASFYSPSFHLQASFYPQVSLAIVRCICFYALISSLLSVCVYWRACGVICTRTSVIRAHIFICVHASAGTRKGPWQAVLNNLKSTQLLWLILETSNVRMWIIILEICRLYFQAISLATPFAVDFELLILTDIIVSNCLSLRLGVTQLVRF